MSEVAVTVGDSLVSVSVAEAVVAVSVDTPAVAVTVDTPVIAVNVGTLLSSGMSAMHVVDVPVPSDTWTVDIGRVIGAVSVYDSQNPPHEIWPGEIERDPGSTKITLKFSTPVSGKVHCHF